MLIVFIYDRKYFNLLDKNSAYLRRELGIVE